MSQTTTAWFTVPGPAGAPEQSLACRERFAAHLLDAVASGGLRPVDRTFSFERLPAAPARVLSDAQTGRIVLTVDAGGR